MRITPPIPAIIQLNDPVGTDTPVANGLTENPTRLPRANNSPRTIGNLLQPSTSVHSTPQTLDEGSGDASEAITLISGGGSSTLTTFTGTPRETNSISTSSRVYGYTVPAVTVAPGRHDSGDRNDLFPAAIGIFVGSIISAIIIWILFGIWLKKKRKAQEFKELEGSERKTSSTKTQGITPFLLPPPAVYTPVHPDSKLRTMQEVLRPVSLVPSLAETRTHSLLHADFMREASSEDLHSLASSPDPFRMEAKVL